MKRVITVGLIAVLQIMIAGFFGHNSNLNLAKKPNSNFLINNF